MSRFYVRWQRDTLEKALKTRRVLLLCGARQCGKTTLVRDLVSQDIAYRTLDDPAMRQIAESDPRGFVRHAGRTLVIDEVQRVPDLLSAIKISVDEDTRPGQYLLTGSADMQSSPGVRESLAGRIRKVRLRPLTHGEVLGTSPDFLDRAFRRDFGHPDRVYDRDAMLDISFGGGFPEAILLGDTERKLWHRNYADALVERDLRDLGRIQRRDAMSELILTLAAWSGKFMDISSIGAGLSVVRSTVETYVNALEALYVVERLRPWKRTDYARAGKRPKLFMTDSGLMSSILGWNRRQVRMDADRSGKLVETFMFNEIAARGGRPCREIRSLPLPRPRKARNRLPGRAGGPGRCWASRSRRARQSERRISGTSAGSGKTSRAKGASRESCSISGELAGSMGDGLWAVPFGTVWNRT